MDKETLDTIKNYVEVNEYGHLITKANLTWDIKDGICGGVANLSSNRTVIGERRGAKTKYGWRFSFTDSDRGIKVQIPAREFVWLYHGNVIPEGMKVKPINGDVLDDRIENLHLVKCSNGRPKGVKEVNKRATKNSTSIKEDKLIVKYRKSYMTTKEIMDKTGCSKAQVLGVIKRYRKKGEIKPFFDTQLLKPYEPEKHLMGVYAIVSYSLDGSGRQIAYIGSSRSLKKRISTHKSHLSKNKHRNKQMQEDYNKENVLFKYYVIEHGEYDHGDLLKLESDILNKYEPCSLYNTWSAPDFDDIKPFLDLAVERHLSDDSNYTVTECGCWQWKKSHPTGYGKCFQVSIDRKKKYLTPHRLSYYKATGEYPELIRHKCDNRLCVNPDHLESGSHQQNGMDKSKQFRKDFEYWWLRYEGDIAKLTEHFGFKKNQKVGSSQIYYWERNIGLRDKYKDLFESVRTRRKNGNK